MEQRYIYDVVMKEFNSHPVQFFSWSADNYCYDYNRLQFDVQGSHFNGRIDIRYNLRTDAFDVEFWENIGYEPLKLKKNLDRVYIDRLVDVIDDYIEK